MSFSVLGRCYFGTHSDFILKQNRNNNINILPKPPTRTPSISFPASETATGISAISHNETRIIFVGTDSRSRTVNISAIPSNELVFGAQGAH